MQVSHSPPVRRYSLRARMVLVLGTVLLLFLGLTGVSLDRAYRNSVEAGAAERLQVQVYLLLAALEQEAGEFFVIEDIQEPRYSQLDSGLYGFVLGVEFDELWRSQSARAFSFAQGAVLSTAPEVGEFSFETVSDSAGAAMFRYSYGILWEDGITPYQVSVVELAAPYFAQIRDFRASLGRWLGGASALLLLALVGLLSWGLRPLSRLTHELRRIEEGESVRLEGTFPEELQGLATNLNRLIDSERKQRERYRTTLSDLAHSLKTPLSIATGALRSGQSKDDQTRGVEQALQRMNQIVSYQLQRAVASPQGVAVAIRVDVASALTNLLAALSKVYAERDFRVEVVCGAKALFHGDERDLLEILGNVLDNAFKYGRSALRVSAAEQLNGDLRVVVEDDGCGVDPSQRNFVLQRGARADTLAVGQGIGLAVVSELLSVYGGSIVIADSELGGAKFTLNFPRVSERT